MALQMLVTAVKATSLTYRLVVGSLLLVDISYWIYKRCKRKREERRV